MPDSIHTGGPLFPGQTPDPSNPSPQQSQAGPSPSTGQIPVSGGQIPSQPLSQTGSKAPSKGFEAELEDCLHEAISHKQAARQIRQNLNVESQRLSNIEAAQSAQLLDETVIQSMQQIDARIDDLADDLQDLRLRLSSVLKRF